MHISLLTLFPDFFTSALQSSMLKRGQEAGAASFAVINIRDFSTDKHHTTDDRPFGGGPGMVMKIEPIYLALEHLLKQKPELPRPGGTQVALTSAKGQVFTQETARFLATLEHLIIICGHYEGVDERVREHLVDQELRIGDFVMTGGEPAALCMADAVTRLLPGVLGNEESTQKESHDTPGFLAHPQFTRPENFNGWGVPPALLTGNHAQITQWRAEQSQAIVKDSDD